MSDNLARVIPFPTRPAEPSPPSGRAPRRRPRNGHHADCPYPERDPRHCGVCASMRKGARHA